MQNSNPRTSGTDNNVSVVSCTFQQIFLKRYKTHKLGIRLNPKLHLQMYFSALRPLKAQIIECQNKNEKSNQP